MIRALAAAVAALLCLPGTLRAASSPPGAPPADALPEIGKETAFRATPGKPLSLRVIGPATVRLELRHNAAPGARPLRVSIDQDGKALPQTTFVASPEASSPGDARGAAAQRLTTEVVVPEGPHTVGLTFPPDTPGDAMVVVRALETYEERAPPPPTPLLSPPPLPGLPVAGPAAPANVLQEPAEPPTVPPRRAVTLRAGALHSAETHTSAATVGLVGILGAVQLAPRAEVFGQVDLRFSRQPYISLRPDAGGEQMARSELRELRTEVLVGGGYDFGRALIASQRVSLKALSGLHYLTLKNGVFPGELFGLSLRGAFGFAPSSALLLKASVGFTYNLVRPRTLSALGAPLWELALSAGVSLPLTGGYALDFAYQGDFLALAFDQRAAHGAAMGLRVSL